MNNSYVQRNETGLWPKLLACLSFTVALAAHAEPPVLTFDAASVTATGLTASGPVVFLGVMRVPKVYLQEVHVFRKLLDADSTGVAQLPVEVGVGRRSVWAAVDLTTGAFSVATPEDYPRNELPLAAESIGRGTDGKPSQLLLSSQVAEVLLVRPGSQAGAGAWSVETVDGSPEDGDGEVDGDVTLGLSALLPLAGEAPPEELAAGDVVVVLDPNALTFVAATVTSVLLNQGGS